MPRVKSIYVPSRSTDIVVRLDCRMSLSKLAKHRAEWLKGAPAVRRNDA
jgi:hypothetical protein